MQHASTGVTSPEVTDIGMLSARFSASFTLVEPKAQDFEVGFEVSESSTYHSSFTTRYKAQANGSTFSYYTEDLQYTDCNYYVRAYLINDKRYYTGETKSFKTDVWQPQYSDLGLSVKWCTSNLCAVRPEQYGYYIAYGENRTKSNFSWRTYQYCENGNYYGLTKYCTSESYGTVDGKTVLEITDDAARAYLGGTWRTPTIEELKELSDTMNCTWTWTKVNDVHGFLVQSRKPGFTDNSIFLPAAGYRDDAFTMDNETYGDYMSSSIDNDYSYDVQYMWFNSAGSSIGSRLRYNGLSVRPVCE